MRRDGDVLPTPTEAMVLHEFRLEALLAAAIDELGPSVPLTTADRRAMAVDWVARNWLRHGNTRHAVNTLSQLAITNLGLDMWLDEFIGLDDEWEDPRTWGRTHDDLESTASRLLAELLHEPNAGR